LKQEKENIVII